MSKTNTNTKHSSIVEYWRDKYITESGVVTNKPPVDQDYIFVIDDIGEPSCWGCNKIVEIDIENDDVSKIWDNAKTKNKLQRCHITPIMFGGKDESENLFLLCPKCHEISPDTTNRPAFMRWIYDRRKSCDVGLNIQELYNKVINEFKRRGFAMSQIEKKASNIEYNELDMKKEIKKRVGMHGFGIAESSMIVGIVDSILELSNKK